MAENKEQMEKRYIAELQKLQNELDDIKTNGSSAINFSKKSSKWLTVEPYCDDITHVQMVDISGHGSPAVMVRVIDPSSKKLVSIYVSKGLRLRDKGNGFAIVSAI